MVLFGGSFVGSVGEGGGGGIPGVAGVVRHSYGFFSGREWGELKSRVGDTSSTALAVLCATGSIWARASG